MHALLVSLLLATSAHHIAWGNFPRDLYGPEDTRAAGVSCDVGPCIYGHADSADLPIQFYPPTGMRVRILSLSGDLIAWVKDLRDTPIPVGSMAGVLAGFVATSSPQSPDCNYCAAGCGLYLQDSVGPAMPKTRAVFDIPDAALLLDEDNILHGRLAEFLNTTGHPIHMELTYRITYVFERPQAPQAANH